MDIPAGSDFFFAAPIFLCLLIRFQGKIATGSKTCIQENSYYNFKTEISHQ